MIWWCFVVCPGEPCTSVGPHWESAKPYFFPRVGSITCSSTIFRWEYTYKRPTLMPIAPEYLWADKKSFSVKKCDRNNALSVDGLLVWKFERFLYVVENRELSIFMFRCLWILREKWSYVKCKVCLCSLWNLFWLFEFSSIALFDSVIDLEICI